MFAAMLDTAANQGIECLGLDSSDAGRPIYLKQGFRMTDQGIELWTGPAAAAGRGSHADARPLQSADWDNLLAFDQTCVKLSRERQLRILAAEAGSSIRVIEEDGALCAFGFSRPGRLTGTIGPVVARDTLCAARIASALMTDRRALDGEKPVGLAVLDAAGFKEWLAGRGFQMRRRNIRMFHPEPRDVLTGPSVFAATGLGMG
jgi:hypothetical protein